ncbi:MAG: hypothetical protein ACI379_13240 [Nocardioides sp.]|uniref:hypothetical protein n=1 Tax=Nocardioides sp. TaxID=35761 RepID=UPI003EFDF07B
MTWHLDAPLWESYTLGRLSPAAEASVEMHVAGCAQCRALARHHDPAPAQVWDDVRVAIAAPPPTLGDRLLRLVGVDERDRVLLRAVDSMRTPWATAVGSAVAAVVLAGQAGRYSTLTFLVLSPLVPVLAVVAAYAVTDPLREVTAATPYSKARLGLLRTVATLAVAIPVLSTLTLLVPALGDLAWVWCLPGLALTSASLALLERFSPTTVGTAVSAAWVALVLVTQSTGELLTVTSAPVQGVAAALAVALACSFVHSTHHHLPRRIR